MPLCQPAITGRDKLDKPAVSCHFFACYEFCGDEDVRLQSESFPLGLKERELFRSPYRVLGHHPDAVLGEIADQTLVLPLVGICTRALVSQ